ncbi:hypothetical protein CVT25_012910 [Psilocybe cyanescens]|uniref:Uncharacterized protein n=1 Tax=Psilocybe cyanescens TaxID=93625 RepID=A0A409XLU1_PSICY|nr:hypothetical protein CVT25_012910 [Psilocybe cyanescens]
MASFARSACRSRLSLPIFQRCGISTTAMARNEATSTVGNIQVQKKPVGGFRGGVVGFLFGFSLASSLAAYHLLDEYQKASAALQASVEELKISTENVTVHVRRIEAVEKDLKALSDASATKEDISRVRTEVKKLYDGLHIEFLDLRAHVWGIQQDLHKLSEKDSTEVRI